MTVTVYSTGPTCYKCKATKRMLEKLEIPYDEEPVTDEVVASAEELGLDLVAPIVCANVDGVEQYWSDYRPDRISALLSAA
jgi:glutaredoxin-like protein NrdH